MTNKAKGWLFLIGAIAALVLGLMLALPVIWAVGGGDDLGRGALQGYRGGAVVVDTGAVAAGGAGAFAGQALGAAGEVGRLV